MVNNMTPKNANFSNLNLLSRYFLSKSRFKIRVLICVSGFALKLLLLIAHRHQKVAYQKHNIHRTCHNKQITSVELDKLRSKLYNCKIDL